MFVTTYNTKWDNKILLRWFSELFESLKILTRILQEDRFSAFRERKTQIEKDVFRTDRTHPFFAGENNKNVTLLQDILMTYVMYNFDLGYVQVIILDQFTERGWFGCHIF